MPVVVRALLALCTAALGRQPAGEHALGTMMPIRHVEASQTSPNITNVLYFVPIAGNSHTSLSKYASGLNMSCTKLRGDGLRTFFAGDHDFIYDYQIEPCFPIVANSPQALNFTFDDLPHDEVTASFSDNCSLKQDSISPHYPTRMAPGLFKRVARIYLSKVDVLCKAAAALGDSSRPAERFALVDAKIGHGVDGGELLNKESYQDLTEILPAEAPLTPGTLRVELYANPAFDLGAYYTGYMNEDHEGFKKEYIKDWLGELFINKAANSSLYAMCKNVEYAGEPLGPPDLFFFVIAKLLVVTHGGHELVRQRWHDMIALMQQNFDCPCFDEEMTLTLMHRVHPDWIREVRLPGPL